MTEEQPYDVIGNHPGFELRRYPDHVVAETRTQGSFEGVGNTAFRHLVGYIGGRNSRSEKVAMTAPVVQEADSGAASEPASGPGRYVVGFVMPAGFELDGAPEPTDPLVQLRRVPAQTAAVLRFSGRWSRGRYQEHARRLQAAVEAAGLTPAGPMRFARYDPPWTPWFLRRNEVVLPVAAEGPTPAE